MIYVNYNIDRDISYKKDKKSSIYRKFLIKDEIINLQSIAYSCHFYVISNYYYDNYVDNIFLNFGLIIINYKSISGFDISNDYN